MDVMMKMSLTIRRIRMGEKRCYISIMDIDSVRRVHYECVLWIGANP